jgi:hypothetical protein
MLTMSNPSMPKMKALEMKAKTKSSTILWSEYDPITTNTRVNKDIQRGKNSIQASITRRPCFNESGSSPL